MPSNTRIDLLIHDLKNPLVGMLDSLEHINDMYENKEDLADAMIILDQTSKKIVKSWNNLNQYLKQRS